MQFSGFTHFFSREMKVSVGSLYILCTLAKLACSVILGSRISSSFAEVKGHDHVAKTVAVGINTCCRMRF